MNAAQLDDQEKAPAALLAGLVTDSGWKIAERVKRLDGQTGAAFSVGYLAVGDEGQIAFLKALDFSSALKDENPVAALDVAVQAYKYEEEMVMLCSNRKMTRIVRALESGYIRVDSTTLGRVPYLLFEPAEGDVRKAIASFDVVTLEWSLSLLHEVAVGLQQLHQENIAHQDLKPSNVLTFPERALFKLTDLGCSSQKGRNCPRDHKRVAGGWSVAPPELTYGEVSEDWIVRRVAADLYALGSLAVFLVTGASMNAIVRHHLPEGKDAISWRGTFREVLPFVRQAYEDAFEFIFPSFEIGPIAQELFRIVRELCEPDPLLRGYRARAATYQQYSIQRYVSRLANLRAQARYAARTILRA